MKPSAGVKTQLRDGETVTVFLNEGEQNTHTFESPGYGRLVVEFDPANARLRNYDPKNSTGEDFYPASIAPRMKMYDPDRVARFSGFSGPRMVYDVRAAGTHSFVVQRGSKFISGFYRLTVTRLPEYRILDPNSRPIRHRETQRVSLEASEMKIFSFEATAGDGIFLFMKQRFRHEFGPEIIVRSPDGEPVPARPLLGGARPLRVIPKTGIYTVDFFDKFGKAGGPYDLTMTRLPNPQTLASKATMLRNGQTHSGGLQPEQMDIFGFEALEGENILLQLSRTNDKRQRVLRPVVFDPIVDIYTPSSGWIASYRPGRRSKGVQVTGNMGERVGEKGTYYLVVRDEAYEWAGNQGSYALTVARVPGTFDSEMDGGVVVNGQTTTGSFAPGRMKIYTFAGSAGDSVSVTAFRIELNNFPEFVLFGPDGEYIVDKQGENPLFYRSEIPPLGSFSMDHVALTRNGRYYLLVRNPYGGSEGLPYKFRLAIEPALHVAKADEAWPETKDVKETPPDEPVIQATPQVLTGMEGGEAHSQPAGSFSEGDDLNLFIFDLNVELVEGDNDTDVHAMPISTMTREEDRDYFVIRYRRNLAAEGVVVEVEASRSLARDSWENIELASVDEVGSDPETGDPLFEIRIDVTGAKSQFLRLRIRAE
ncbi:MAG: hypothetical protein WD490_05095 [Opitutales bacterium]